VRCSGCSATFQVVFEIRLPSADSEPQAAAARDKIDAKPASVPGELPQTRNITAPADDTRPQSAGSVPEAEAVGSNADPAPAPDPGESPQGNGPKPVMTPFYISLAIIIPATGWLYFTVWNKVASNSQTIPWWTWPLVDLAVGFWLLLVTAVLGVIRQWCKEREKAEEMWRAWRPRLSQIIHWFKELHKMEEISRRTWTPRLSWLIVHRAARKWWDHDGQSLGASLAFYAVFSATPMLWLAISVAGAVFDDERALQEVRSYLRQIVNAEVADYIHDVLAEISNPDKLHYLAIGLVLFLYAASSVFLEAQAKLCMICELEPMSPRMHWRLLRKYGEAIAVVLMITLLLTGSLILHLELLNWEEASAELLFTCVFITLLFTGIYRILSSARIEWGYCWYSSIITCVLLMLGRSLLYGYILAFPVKTAYGQAGLVMILMLWLYYSAQVFYFGAELMQARRTRLVWLAEM
jgi:membrane protein